MQLTITIPDDVAAQLQNGAGGIARKILEFVAIQGYQSEALTAYDVQKMLGFESRFEVDAFFKAHGVRRDYTLEDLGRERETAATLRDFTADWRWLADHRDEYAGQWVALKSGRLISHGANAREVHMIAQDSGHSDAPLVLVEPSDAPPFIL
ncbi:MAG TPA: UPF0175 family protein [Blastocatellia bacterium]|nr:UPF0175 family protein [Blastocatellia bacterium]